MFVVLRAFQRYLGVYCICLGKEKHLLKALHVYIIFCQTFKNIGYIIYTASWAGAKSLWLGLWVQKFLCFSESVYKHYLVYLNFVFAVVK